MIQSFFSRQFIVFLITGGIAALVNFGSRFVYSQWLSYSASVVFAYITGMITAFFLAKIFVFKESQQSIQHSVMFFFLVNLVAIAQTWIISMGLAYYFFPYVGITVYVEEIAHAIGIAVPVFTSYIGHKRWSFR